MRWGWKWMWAGWLVVAALGSAGARAQGTTTTVQDTLTDASGAPASGTVVVSWAAFTTAAGAPVAAGSLATTLGAGGALSVGLLPNVGATPMGSYYTAVYHLSDGTTSREFWVVPATTSGTVKLAGIRNQVLPTAMAMQTVSKQYVDTTVAKAMAGVAPSGSLPYLLKGGDTMAGPLLLAADPTQALQAANKHYVDTAVASAGSGVAAGGDLSGAYPNPTVAAVHAAAGTLDGVTVGGAVPSAGTFTALSAANVQVSANINMSGSLNIGGQGLSNSYGLVYTPNAVNQQFQILGTSLYVGTAQTAGAYSTVGWVYATAYHEALTTPASSSASCSAGDFTDDANFHYVCVAASAWKRVALSTF